MIIGSTIFLFLVMNDRSVTNQKCVLLPEHGVRKRHITESSSSSSSSSSESMREAEHELSKTV